MKTSKEEARQLFAQNPDIEAFLDALTEREQDPNRTALLRRCALVRSFDEELLRGPLSSDLPDARSVSIGDFLRSPEIIPSAATPGQYCLKESARTGYLTWWNLKDQNVELRRFSAAMLQALEARGPQSDPMDVLGFRAFAQPARARADFLTAYHDADLAADFSACETLLNLLRWYGPLLPDTLRADLRDRECYFTGRVMFADDWARTERFLERDAVTERFDAFWLDPNKWIFQIHGKGGSGKTAYLRWLTARYLVVEGGLQPVRTPVAKIDMDFVRLAQLDVAPWLILLPIGRQFDVQLIGRPFYSVFPTWLEYAPLLDRLQTGPMDVPSQPALDGFIADFASALGTMQVVVILDTLEELVLRHAQSLRTVLDIFERLRRISPGFRLILSGRYELGKREETADVMQPFLPATTAVSLSRFSEQESLRYLAEIRGLRGDFDLAAIVQKSGRNPFKLALYADLAIAHGKLTKQDVLDLGDVELAYLIERIIERIPDSEMPVRWLLRYVVLPRAGALTYEFVDQVLRTHLELEMRRKGLKLLDNAEQGVWKTVEGVYTLEKIWSDLLRYRSESSWITTKGDQPSLQPEIVVPMRELLQKEEIFCTLHADAAGYFDRKGDWPNSIYHRFWADGPAAVQAWRNALHNAPSLTQALDIASIVCGGDLLDEDGGPLRHQRYGKVVDEATVAEAFFERAALHVRLHLLKQNSNDLLQAQSDLDRVSGFEGRGGKTAIDRGRHGLVEAALLSGRGEPERALTVLDDALLESNDESDKIALNVLKARLVNDVRLATQCLETAESLSENDPHAAFPVSWLRARQGKAWHDGDILDEAERCYTKALSALDAEKAPVDQIVNCLETLVGIARSQLRYSKADTWVQYAEQLTDHSETAMLFFRHYKARLLLDRGNLEDAMVAGDYGNWGRVPGGVARQEELWGDQYAAANRFEDAVAYYDRAAESHRADSKETGIADVTLKKARMILEDQGDLRSATERKVRSQGWSMGSLVIQNELQVLRLVKMGKAEEARARWREMESRVRNQPRNQARWGSLGLALNLATDPETLLNWFQALEQVQPWQARLRLLDPFRHWNGEAVSIAGDTARGFMPLFPRPDENDPDFIFQALALAPAIAYFGGSDAAAGTIHEALQKTPDKSIALRRKFILAAAQLGYVLPDKLVRSFLEDPEELNIKFPEFWHVVRIGLAEYWWNDGQYQAAEQVLDGQESQSLRGSQYEFRYYLVLSALRSTGDPATSGLYFDRATSIAEQLGWPPPRRLTGAPDQESEKQASVLPRCEKLIIHPIAGDDPKALSITWQSLDRRPAVARSRDLPFAQMFSPDNRTAAVDSLENSDEAVARLRNFLPEAFWQPSPRKPGIDAMISTTEGPLAGLPWEQAVEPRNFRFIFRAPNPQLPQADTVMWLQQWLTSNGFDAPLDGVLGPRTMDLLSRADQQFHILVDGWSGVETKKRMRRQSSTEIAPVVIPVLLSGRSGYSMSDLPVEVVYRDNGLRVYPFDLTQTLIAPVDTTGCFIHIPLDFTDAREGVALNTGPADRTLQTSSSARDIAATSITAERLAREMKGLPEKLFVLLDPPHPGHQREWAKQLLLRNQFAHDLVNCGFARAVLATGFAEPNYQSMKAHLNGLLTAMAQFACAGELVPLGGPFCSLFCFDPTLPAL